MRTRWVTTCAIVAAVLLFASPAWAQYGALKGEIRKQCLSDEDLKQIAIFKAKVQSSPQDPVVPFNPDYFVGSWDIEGDAPDAPWSEAGTTTGTVIFKYVENCLYEGQLQGIDPAGRKYTAKVQLVYNPLVKHLTWLETDSRGFTLLKTGHVGGDHGGNFTFFWEAPVFTYKGKVVRLFGQALMFSPAAVRHPAVISVDGSPAVNFGTPLWRKVGITPPAQPR